MAQLPAAGMSWPYVVGQSHWGTAAAAADTSAGTAASESESGSYHFSPLLPVSAAFQSHVGRRPLFGAAGESATATERRRSTNPQAASPSLVMPSYYGDASSLSAPSPPFSSLSRRSHYHPTSAAPAAAAANMAATPDKGRAATFSDAPPRSWALPPYSYNIYERDHAFLMGDASTGISGAVPSYRAAAAAASDPQPTAHEGAERRIPTQRPLHRAHPYGSSLFRRLVNKIRSSLSSLVSRAPGISSGDADTTAAGAAVASSPSTKLTAEEASPCTLLYSPPLVQQPVYGGSLRSDVLFNAAASSPRQTAAPAAAEAACGGHPDSASASAAPLYAAEKSIQAASGEGVSLESSRELLRMWEQQLVQPYYYCSSYYQTHPAVDRDAAAPVLDARNKVHKQAAFPSSLSYEQQLLLQHEQQPDEDEQQQPPLRQQQQQQQRLGRLQQQQDGRLLLLQQQQDDDEAGEEERLRVAGRDVDEGVEGRLYSTLSAAGAVPTRWCGVISEEDERARERGEGGAAGLDMLSSHSYYELRRPGLAESCFDSIAAADSGAAAAGEDAGDAYGATVRLPSATQKQQKHARLLLPSSKGLDGVGDAAAAATEAELQQNCVPYVDSRVPRGVMRRRIFDVNGELLASDESPALLTEQQQQFLRQGPQHQGDSSATRFLPMRRGYIRPPETQQQQQQQQAESGGMLFSGLQEETGSNISLSRTSSNSIPIPAVDEDGRYSQVGRRPRRRGWGGASSSLFSPAVAPAWLAASTGAGLPLDAPDGAVARGSPGAAAPVAAAADSAAAGAAGDPGVSVSAVRAAPPPRSSRGERGEAGPVTRKSAAMRSNAGVFPYVRQEQLTVEQLQKLYLRCQPLRWRVRLRDILRQEAVAAAAAETTKKKTHAKLLKEMESSGTASSSSSAAAAAAEEDAGGVDEKQLGGGIEEKDANSSSLRTQLTRGDHPETTADRYRSALAATAAAADEANPGKRTKLWNLESATTITPEQQQRRGDSTAAAGSRSGGLVSHITSEVMQQTTSSTAQGREEEKEEGGKEKFNEQQTVKSSISSELTEERTSRSSGSGGGVGVYAQDNRGTTLSGGDSSHRGMEAISPATLGDAAGSKRSRVSSDKAATDGCVGVHRSLFASDSRGSSTGEGGGSEGVTSSLFGSSSRSLFGSHRTTAPVGMTGSAEAGVFKGGGTQVGEGRSSGSSSASSSSSLGSTAGEARDVSLFGKTLPSRDTRVSGSVPAPVFGSSNSSSGSSSLFAGGLTTTGSTQQLQQKDSSDSSAGKTAAAPALSSPFGGGAAPASSLFGGARSSSSLLQQQQHVAATEELVGGSVSQKSTVNEQTLCKEDAAAGGVGAIAPEGDTKKDAAACGGGAAATAAGAAEKPTEETQATSALPWWQQNLNKPCSVMPEEDFAPEADDEEGEDVGKERTTGVGGSNNTENSLPPLKMPNIFGSSISSGGGLFGSAGTTVPSLFKDAAGGVVSSTAAAPAAGTTPAAAPSLFGSAATGLWTQNSSTSSGSRSSSSLFGGLVKPFTPAAGAAPAAATSTPQTGSLFGALGASKQSSSSQLPSAGSAATSSLFGLSSGNSGAAGEEQQQPQPSWVSGSSVIPPTGSNVFATTQKASASLFGGSIFGNPVASSQATNTSQLAAGTSTAAAPTGGGAAGLFVFGASGGGGGSSMPPLPSTTATTFSASQTQKGSGDIVSPVPSLFGSSLGQQQAASTGAGKRGRDDPADGGSIAAGTAAGTTAGGGKSLFGVPPPSESASSGEAVGLFGQRLQTAGRSSSLVGGVASEASNSSLFNSNSSSTAPGTTSAAGQTDGKNVVGLGGGSTGFLGSTSFLGDKGNNSNTTTNTMGSLLGASRSTTPVFGTSSSGNKDGGASSSVSTPNTGGVNTAASTATGSSSSSSGLFGSSSNNNPFGFGGSTTGNSGGGVSLFGSSSSSSSNTMKPFDSSRPTTTEGSFTTTQQQSLWPANKGNNTTQQGLFSTPAGGNSIGGGGAGTGVLGGTTPNGVFQPQRSLFGGGLFAGSISSATGNTTSMPGGANTAPNSLFGSAAGAPSTFTFGTVPPTLTSQQQQQQTAAGAAAAPPAAAGGGGGGAEGGNGANSFFGAPSSGVRRPRLTIKRTKQ